MEWSLYGLLCKLFKDRIKMRHCYSIYRTIMSLLNKTFVQKSYSNLLVRNFNIKNVNLLAQVSDIGPPWSSCLIVAIRFFPHNHCGKYQNYIYISQSRVFLIKAYMSQFLNAIFVSVEYIKILRHLIFNITIKRTKPTLY